MAGTDSSYDALAETPQLGGAEASAPGASFGRFVMKEVLGRGGMGVVMEAYDPELDRKVAIKLLHSDAGAGEGARLRLQHEAQAMARLAHPNVVTVYEVGLAADQQFIAMELVDGTTLRTWLARSRGWREVVAMFIAAGRGLEAAHQAGLIHRDFKPENVLIGRDGRPRVSDFGLAARELVAQELALSTAGTPAYMSPEQWRGGDLDARSDQFSFCAALWRAVWGEGPFAGNQLDVLRASVLAGALRTPPRRRAPRWLGRALARGLALDPADRWPSLGALLDTLRARMSVRRRVTWLAAGASGGAVVAVAIAVATASGTTDPCGPPTARTEAVWGQGRRAAIEHHLLAIDPVLGGKRFTAIAAVFDRGVPGWADMHVSACRATRVDGGQSDTLLDLRMRCLDGWLARLGEVADDLERAPDPKQLEATLASVSRVGALERCADTTLLQAVAPPPVDPVAAVEVQALAGELSSIRAAHRAGELAGLVSRADAAVARARHVGHPPALVDALSMRADLAGNVGDTPGEVATLREIVEVAARAHDDERAAKTWASLVSLVGEFQGRPAEAKAMMPAARAASARVGDPPLLLAQVLGAESRALAAAGDTDAALADLDRAHQLLEAAGATQPGSPAAPLLVATLHSLGTAYSDAGQLDRAVAALRQAIALADTTYGPDTVHSGSAYLTLGESLRDQTKLDEAEHALRESARIREARTGQSTALAISLISLAEVIGTRGHDAEATAIGERAIAIARASLPAGDPVLATIIASLADIYALVHRPREALGLYNEVLAIVDSATIDTRNVAAWSINRGKLLRTLGRCADAFADLHRAAEIGERIEGPKSRYVGSALRYEGGCLHDLHRDAEAIAALERSMACEARSYHAEDVGVARVLLGRLLVAAGRDRVRGAALIREGREQLRALGSPHAGD